MLREEKSISFDDLISNLINKNFNVLEEININNFSNEEIKKLKEVLKKELKNELLVELRLEVQKEVNKIIKDEPQDNKNMVTEAIKKEKKEKEEKPIEVVNQKVTNNVKENTIVNKNYSSSNYDKGHHLTSAVMSIMVGSVMLGFPVIIGSIIGDGSNQLVNGSGDLSGLKASMISLMDIMKSMSYLLGAMLGIKGVYHMFRAMSD